MRLGNDLVDLNAAGETHPRFARRVLSDAEYEFYLRSGESRAQLWSYWAAKEAAYKAVRQGRSISFSPRLWTVSPLFDRVSFAGESLVLRLRQEDDLILAEVCDGDWKRVVSAEAVFFSEPRPSEQREEARRLILGLAAASLSLPDALSGFDLIKEDGVPRLRASGTHWAVSLSHHGRFVAACLALDPLPPSAKGLQSP